MIDDTGTELERVLTYYKLTSLDEMTEGTYRRALDLLQRKRSKAGPGGRQLMPKIERLHQNTPRMAPLAQAGDWGQRRPGDHGRDAVQDPEERSGR